MRSRRSSTHRTASRLCTIRAALVLLLLLASFTAGQLKAQTPPQQPPPEASLYTLHVYANLVQIPTLVLSPNLLQLPPISKDKFNISLDAGPSFHPTHMRIEGDDPINLSILLDSGDDAYRLQPALSLSISNFIGESLLPHDHVSIYAIGCTFIRTADDLPASDNAAITQSLNNAIHDPKLHGRKGNGSHCGRSVQLWSALGKVALSMNDAPERRIILAVTTGDDHHSKVKWNALKHYAASRSITIFGMYPEIPFEHQTLRRNGNSIITTTYQNYSGHLSTENPFNELCQLTGGLVLFTSSTYMPTELKYFIDLIRARYILEFPRPDNSAPGTHIIDVTLANTSAYIRPAGISIPLPDPSLLSSPTTIPSPPSPAVIGKRHTLDPH